MTDTVNVASVDCDTCENPITLTITPGGLAAADGWRHTVTTAIGVDTFTAEIVVGCPEPHCRDCDAPCGGEARFPDPDQFWPATHDDLVTLQAGQPVER